jgi:superfamily II DNA helicase RecQ
MLTAKDLPTIHITSGIDDSTEEALFEGRFRVIFISPEELSGKKKWRDMLRYEGYWKTLTAFMVDEAHCVKEWYA